MIPGYIRKSVCYNYSTKSIQIAQLDLGIPIIDQSNCPTNWVLFKLTVAADQPMWFDEKKQYSR